MKKLILLIGLLGITARVSSADEKLSIVTTLPSYASIAKSIGGDYVETASVAQARFNPHFIEPRPSDVLKVKRAALFIHSGLDLEAWRGPLVDAAARADIRSGGNAQLDLSTGIEILEKPSASVTRAEGDIHIFGNPHYWIDPENGKIIAREIAGKLIALDPSHAEAYTKNLASFLTVLDAKIAEWKKTSQSLKGKELVGYHNEWVYLMKFLGLRMEQFLEPKAGIPPTPKQLEFLTSYMKEKHIRGIVQATYYPDEASRALAEKTGAKVLFLCQNVGELPEAPDYVAMVDYNVRQIAEALSNG